MVAEELNFRRAADRSHVSQPALSKQVRDLEAELGLTLLDRNTARVRLTDAGRVLLVEARAILARVNEAVALTRDAAGGRRGQLCVGNIAAISANFMPATLTAFRRQYPEVDVTLREVSSAEQVAALASGAIQIGFTLSVQPPLPETVERFLILRSPLRAVLGRAHRLARQPRVALADLAAEPMLGLSNARGSLRHKDILVDLFAARGLSLATPRLVEGFDSLIASIASGAGITLLPEIADTSRAEGIVFRPLRDKGDDLQLDLWAIWRKGETSRLAHNFVTVLREMRQQRSRRVPAQSAAGGASRRSDSS